jgi:hypothetical protein
MAKPDGLQEGRPRMRKLLMALAMTMLAMVSCARQERTTVAERTMEKEKKGTQEGVPSLTPPKELDDAWSRWLIGEWESTAESDLPAFKCWVRGTGRMKAELGVGGQFLVVTKEGEVTQLSEEYVHHLRQTLHTSEDQIEKLRQMKFAEVDFRTIDPRTGGIVAYLFDSWRCVATGTGRCDGSKEVIEWKWSAGGQGTSVRTTERVGEDEFTVTEKYAMPDGSTMEDRVRMVRRR